MTTYKLTSSITLAPEAPPSAPPVVAPLPLPSAQHPRSSDKWQAASDKTPESTGAETPAPHSPFSIPHSPLSGEAAAPLLEGFRILLQFLMEQEAEYLCGTPLRIRSQHRANYRMGYYARKFRTPVGVFPLRVPHLRFFYPRVSITKRARRLAPEVLEILSSLLTPASAAPFARSPSPESGVPSPESPLLISNLNLPVPAAAAALIKTLWTLELPASLLSVLVERLTPLLSQWRQGSPSHPVRLDPWLGQATPGAEALPPSVVPLNPQS